MKTKIAYLALLLSVCLVHIGCSEDDDNNGSKESLSLNFKIEASKDLIENSDPMAVYTNHFGKKDTIMLKSDMWESDENSSSEINTHTCVISKNYNFLPVNNSLAVIFVPKEGMPDNPQDKILYSNLTYTGAVLTETGTNKFLTFNSTDINIDINIGGGSKDEFTPEEWAENIKSKSRTLKVSVDKDGNDTTEKL